MKLFRYVIIIAAAVSVFASCGEGAKGAGDATIGFEQASYVYRESDGLIRIPVKFTGEPSKYPITFNIVATVDPGKGMVGEQSVTVDQVAHFIQLNGFRYAGNPDGPVFIEVKLENDDVINDSRFLTLSVASVSGAEIVNGETTIEIRDNDSNPYDRLQGKWGMYCVDWDDNTTKGPFDIYVMDGFTEEEAQKNRDENRLLCYGFGGFSNSPAGVPFVWYLDYNYNADTDIGVLSLATGNAIIDADEDLFGINLKPTAVIFGTMPFNTQTQDIDFETIYAQWSEDYRIITFDPEIVLVPLLFSNGAYTGYTMGKLSKIKMVLE